MWCASIKGVLRIALCPHQRRPVRSGEVAATTPIFLHSAGRAAETTLRALYRHRELYERSARECGHVCGLACAMLGHLAHTVRVGHVPRFRSSGHFLNRKFIFYFYLISFQIQTLKIHI
jgi:hypothetical protein